MAGEGSIGVERSVQLRMNGGRCFAGAEISEGSTNAHAVVNEGAEGPGEAEINDDPHRGEARLH